MKRCLTLALLLLMSAIGQAHPGGIAGRVFDEKKQAIIGAIVLVSDSGIKKGGAVTGPNGDYHIGNLKAGKKYELKVTYAGYMQRNIKAVVVNAGKRTMVNVSLELNVNMLQEVRVMSYREPLVEAGHPHGVIESSAIRNTGITNTADLVAVTSPGIHTADREVEAFGGRGDVTEFIVDGAIVSGSSVGDEGDDIPVTKRAGLLTSGEVNDFSKWKLWQDLSIGELKSYSDVWKILPQHRYTVLLKNRDNMPVCNAQVLLKDKRTDSTIWEAVTDNTGKAELWNNIFPGVNDHPLYATINYNGRTFKIKRLHPFSDKINMATLPVPCNVPKALDVAFIVDATGSMQDEINYLKEELYDVINKVKDSLPEHELRMGAVFYRDHGDTYLTKVSELSKDINKTIDFIKANNADGGGDGPEAVDDALDAAINELEWNNDAIARIAFLVLDAPPHDNGAVVARIHTLVLKYAKLGIRLVPVVCSGSDKSNEYLMRSLALATNGTFIFLTDHSGIGEHHTEASTDKYDVEYMNQLVFRIIYQFSYGTSCKQEPARVVDTSSMTNKPQPDTSLKVPDTLVRDSLKYASWKYYPNPSTGVIYIEYENAGGAFFISDISGKLILRLHAGKEGRTSIDMTEYPSGIYFIKYEYGAGKWLSGKFTLLH